MACDGFPDRIIMPIKLVSNGRPDEVGPVGVEALMNKEIDVAQVDIAKIDRDLFTVRGFRPKFVDVTRHINHPITIYLDGNWSPYRKNTRPGSDLSLNSADSFASRFLLRPRPSCSAGLSSWDSRG